MKKKIFNEEDSIELIEVLKNKQIYRITTQKNETVVFKNLVISNKIFTDGKIIEIEEPKEEKITKYYIGKEKYRRPVDIKLSRKV